MKILYVSYDGLTDPLGPSQILPYIIGLAAKGHHFTILSAEKKERYGPRHEEVARQLEEHGIEWKPIRFTRFPPLLAKSWDLLKIAYWVWALHRKRAFDLFHCRSYVPAQVALWMKKRFGLKFLFDMRGFWVDERMGSGIWNPDRWIYRRLYRFYKAKEVAYLSNADYVITVTEKGREIVQGMPDVIEQPIPTEVIPCCVDVELFSRDSVSPERSRAMRKLLGIAEGEFVLVYLGNIGTWYMLDEMLQFFQVLLGTRPDARFLFITHAEESLIRSRAEAIGVPERAVLIQEFDRRDVPACLTVADLAIFFITPVFSKQGSSPTKQAEIMSIGLPVVCNAGIGDTDRIIQDYGAGELVTEFSDRAFEDIVSRLDEICALPKDRMIAGAREYYSLEKGVGLYHSVYQRISAS